MLSVHLYSFGYKQIEDNNTKSKTASEMRLDQSFEILATV